MHCLKKKNVLVVGMGVSGRSAAEFLIGKGANVSAVDQNFHNLTQNFEILSLKENGLKFFSEDIDLKISQFDLLVISPGVPPTNRFCQAAKKEGIEIIGEIELACRHLNQKMFAITGTNGKTTTTLLVEHILNVCGIPAKALGNVGTPLTKELSHLSNKDNDFIAVVELSSYQLETLQSRVIDAGVILNITPDHLDRYAAMDEYAKAKIRMKDCLKPNGKLYIEDKCLSEYGAFLKNFPVYSYGYSPSCTIYANQTHLFFEEKIESILPPSYRGRVSHDLENLMAAYALCREAGVNAIQFTQAIESFKKPPHRIEFVRKIRNISFYDDSKGTNLDAVIRAVNSIEGNIVLIAGGVDKGSSYTPWIKAFGGRVKSICVIGQAAEKIKEDLSHAIPVKVLGDLESAVKLAVSIAQPGETVLLSPGCSSFDMFRDYAHRGDEFKKIVNALV